MGRKNVNRVNCSETVETPANYYKSVENVRPFIAFDASRPLNEWVETGDDEMISLHGLDLTIKNEPGVVLPSTGWPGMTAIYTILNPNIDNSAASFSLCLR